MLTYIVCDVEANGPIPGPYSMISFGAVAVSKEEGKLGEFEINLKDLENSTSHPVIMKWYHENAPEALNYAKKDPVDPSIAINKFADWLLTIPGKRIMAAHPSPFDFMWLNWYMQKFLESRLERPYFLQPFFDIKAPASFDIKSYATGILNLEYTDTYKNNYPENLYSKSNHTHKAIDDAHEYANFLIKLLNIQKK